MNCNNFTSDYILDMKFKTHIKGKECYQLMVIKNLDVYKAF